MGVCGGNILEGGHWKELVEMLLNGKDGDGNEENGNANNRKKGKDSRKQKVGAGELCLGSIDFFYHETI